MVPTSQTPRKAPALARAGMPALPARLMAAPASEAGLLLYAGDACACGCVGMVGMPAQCVVK